MKAILIIMNDDEVDILRDPAYYDTLYYPRFHHSTFATAEGVQTWLNHHFSSYAAWIWYGYHTSTVSL